MIDTPEDALIIALTAERDALINRLRETEASNINLRERLADTLKSYGHLQRYVAIVAPGTRRVAREVWDDCRGYARVEPSIADFSVTGKTHLERIRR